MRLTEQRVVNLIVAGSRNIEPNPVWLDAVIETAVYEWWPKAEDVTIISGCAPGVDTAGELAAQRIGYRVRRFPADWKKYGRAAGPFRNAEMARVADGALVIMDGEPTPGSSNMVARMLLDYPIKPVRVLRAPVRK